MVLWALCEDFSRRHGGSPDRAIGIAAPVGQTAGTFQQRQGHTGQGAVFQSACAVVHEEQSLIPAMFAVSEPVGRQGITHEYQLITRHSLQ